MTEYWHLLATIPISQELIAKLRGEHWERWPSPEAELRVKPLLEAIERRKHGHREPWRPLTDDELRAHYGTRTEEV